MNEPSLDSDVGYLSADRGSDGPAADWINRERHGNRVSVCGAVVLDGLISGQTKL